MASTDTVYSARFELMELMERGRDNLLQCRVYRAGALVAPDAETPGTVTVYNDAGAKVVNAAEVTVTGTIAGYNVAAATLAAYDFGDGWRVEWALLMADGVVHIFRNDAALVYDRFDPPITEADLYRRASALDPNGTAPITRNTSFVNQIDEAHVEIQGLLIERGRRPWQIYSSSSLRKAYLTLTLAIIFEDLASRTNEAYELRAAGFRAEFKDAMANAIASYTLPDNTGIEAKGKGLSHGGIWLNGRE